MYNGYRDYFPGVKRLGVALTTHPPPSAEVKEIVELYLYSRLCAFIAGYKVNVYLINVAICICW
jgi:hypothetical protein